jgi:hypothetical protein
MTDARADEMRIRGGIDALRPSGDEVVALMRTLRQRIDDCRKAQSVSPLMEYLYSNLGRGGDRLSAVPVACRTGCSHCCHSPWIDATPPEVLYAVSSIPEEKRRRTAETVDEAGTGTRGKSLQERSRVVTPCPLLESDACSVYAGRPVVCRSRVSSNADACRRAYLELSGESFPAPAVWNTLGAAYAVSLEAAVVNAGLVPTARSLSDCLPLALADRSLEARWLGGEDVFKGSPRAYESSNLDSPSWTYLYRQAFGAAPPRRG